MVPRYRVTLTQEERKYLEESRQKASEQYGQ